MRVAAIQMSSGADRDANTAVAERLVRAAAADGAQLIVLPEKWTAMGSNEQLRAAAQPLEGSAIEWARALAGELRVELIAGSVLEILAGEEKLANTSVHVDAHGEIRAVYRKVHMFDVEVGGHTYRESDLEQPGEELVLSHTADGVGVAMSVCYDLRFPELYQVLAAAGARVIVIPAAFTLATTRDHWETLVRARAIENQAFVIAANQFGEHPGGQRSGGRSLIVDPWGVVLAQARDGDCQIVADLDLEAQSEIRSRLPSLANRRPSAYRLSAEARA